MTYSVTVEGISPLARKLAIDLRPAIEAGALAIAAAIQDDLAPYPPARPRRPGKPYYVRGKGAFTAAGVLIRSSELLNRRWDLRTIPLGARLRNTASYAGWVHGRKQAAIHAKTGWHRVDQSVAVVVNLGMAQRLMQQAIAKRMATR